MEQEVQLFVSVNSKGGIAHAQMGRGIVMTDSAFPYVFIISEETASRLAKDTSNFQIEIVDFEPKLIELTEPEPES